MEHEEKVESEEEKALESNIPVIQDSHRFGFIESFFLIALNLIADVLEILDITGIGAIVGFLVDFLIGLPTLLYLYLKGTPRVISRNAIANATELIPFLDISPTRTIVIILTILAANNPEKWGKYMGLADAITPKGGIHKK